MSARLSRSHTGIETIILLTANKAHITDINITLSTILFTYKEKNVSAHNHHPNINLKRERLIHLIETGMEKKSFSMIRKILFGCCFFLLVLAPINSY